MGGDRAEVRHDAPVRGTGHRRSAAAPVVDPEIAPEGGTQLLGPLPQPGAARSAVRVEQIGAEEGRAVCVRLRLAAQGAAGLRVGKVGAVAHGRAQPGQTALGRREQFLGLLLGEPPATSLREEHGEEQCGLCARTARRQVRARVPARSGEHAGPRARARELGAGEGAQGARGESGAERECHPGGGKGLGRGHAAAPWGPCREMGVGGMRGVAQEEGLEVLDAGP